SHLAIERLLGRHRVMAVEKILWHGSRTLERRAENRDDSGPQFGEKGAQLTRANARLVLIEQCIVARFLKAPVVRHLAIELQEFLQVRLEGFEFGTLPRLSPGLARMRACPFEFLDQSGRQFRGAVVTPAPFAQVCRLIRFRPKSVL